MKKINVLVALFAAVVLTLSSCSGGSSKESMLFGDLPSEYADLKAEKDKLKEKAQNITSEAEKAELIKKGKELDEKWAPKLEKAAMSLDGKEIDVTDSIFKVTEPLSLTFEKLGSKNLEPIFKVNGTAVTAEDIIIENTFNPTRLVYIVGYDSAGEKLYSIKIGSITVNVKLNVLEIPAGTPIDFSTLTFDGAYVDKYPETKTLKLTYF